MKNILTKSTAKSVIKLLTLGIYYDQLSTALIGAAIICVEVIVLCVWDG